MKNDIAKPQIQADALSVLERIDGYRNLHTGVAVLCFFVSAGFGVLAFFLATELALWFGVSKHAALLVVSVSWVLIFPVWVLVYLIVLSLLGALGIRDLRAAVRHRLSDLTLSPDQLRDLQGALVSRPWRHGRIFKRAIAELSEQQARPH